MSFDGLCIDVQLIVAQQLFFAPRDCTALCGAHLRFGRAAQQLLARCKGPLFGAVLLLVAQHVLDPRDCAALCLAHPRIGLQVRRRIARYQDPLVCVALRLLSEPSFSIDEPLLRRCAVDAAFTYEVCEWLRGDGSGLHLVCRAAAGGLYEERLLYNGEVEGALIMCISWNHPKSVNHYEGEKDAERLVRREWSGRVFHFEGERLVRKEYPDGTVKHYEGEMYADRLVRTEFPDGTVKHYEGEIDAERVRRLSAIFPSLRAEAP